MGKVSELTKLIKDKHPEWIKLSIRDLAKASGYKKWVAEAVKKDKSTDDIKTQDKTNGTPLKVDEKKESESGEDESDGVFIDDPDELLLSVAIRELNRPRPDPRWASILISTRKENIGQSKKEGKIRRKFKSMNITDIAKILSTKPKDISQEPDLMESS